MDNVSLLNKLTKKLNATQFLDAGERRCAQEIIRLADTRKRYVAAYYRKLLVDDPQLKAKIDQFDPDWQQW
jgi:hypothetical protein